jgi:hypothetical protein
MRLRRVVTGLFVLAGLCAFGQGGCAGTPACERNSDCSEGFCVDGECRKACVDSALDCPKGYVCNLLSQCEPQGQTVGTAAVGPGAATAGVGASSAASGGGSGQLLDVCSVAAECGSGLACQPMAVGGPSRCTRPCGSDADCMSGTRCIDRGGKYCIADDVGRACTDPSACNFGCLTGPKYCTAACTTGADCPAGYGCQGVGNPSVRVCVKAAAYCASGDATACIAPSACDLSGNLIVGGCTLACSSASDCPQRAAPLAPWSCDGLCRRPADVVGSLPGGYSPVEYFCDGSGQPVALCNDAQHMNFDQFTVPNPPAVNCNSNQTTLGSPGDACVDSCRYRGGCGHGYACVGAGNVGNSRIGLCLPTGSSEPGVPCTKARDCAFGYCTGNNVCSRDCTEDGVCPSGTTCVAPGGPTVEGKPFRRCE